MKFKRDQEVRVNTDAGVSLGFVLEDIDLHGETYWWIQYQRNGVPEVSPFSEKHLSEWNQTYTCICGAHSSGQPGHTNYCEEDNLK